VFALLFLLRPEKDTKKHIFFVTGYFKAVLESIDCDVLTFFCTTVFVVLM